MEVLSLNHWTARKFPPVTSCNTGYLGFSVFKKINLFVYLFAVLGLHCCESISVVVVYGFLIAMAFLVVKHWPYGAQASVVVAHGHNCFMACGIFPGKY